MGNYEPTDAEMSLRMKEMLIGQESLRAILSPTQLLWLKVFYDQGDEWEKRLRLVYKDKEKLKTAAVKEFVVPFLERQIELRIEDYIKVKFHEDPAMMTAVEEFYKSKIKRKPFEVAAFDFFYGPETSKIDSEAELIAELHEVRDRATELEPVAAEIIFTSTIEGLSADREFGMLDEDVLLLNKCILIIGKKRARELFNDILAVRLSKGQIVKMLKKLETVIQI